MTDPIKHIKDIQTIIGTTADGIWGEKSKQALKEAIKKGVIIPISEHFTLNELLASNTAKQLGIDNMPTQKVLENLIQSIINLFEPARQILGVPMKVTSGYRCPALNKAVGGVKNSSHLYGYAIDFQCPKFGTPAKIVPFLVKQLKAQGIGFDQAIIEYPKSANSWVHLAYKKGDGKQRNKAFVIG